MNTITFRSVQPSEYSMLAGMINALYSKDGQEKESWMTDEKISRTLERLISHPEHLQIDIFFIQNVIAGYAMLFSYWSNDYGGLVLNIDELYVLPEYRGRNIASLYLAHLEEQNDSYAALTMEVIKDNMRALELYRKLGYEETGRWHLIKYKQK